MSAIMAASDELFVHGLASDAPELEVKELFEKHSAGGKIIDYFVVSKKKDSKSQGDKRAGPLAALIRLDSHQAAASALKALNRFEFKGRSLAVKWSNSQRVLYVGNLHESITNETLQAAFSQFGEISKAIVVMDPQSNSSKCYGFVMFANKREASKAIQRCSQEPFMIGSSFKPVKVEWARIEDTSTGYSDEIRHGKVQEIDADSVSHFASKGTREHQLSSMRKKRDELTNQLLMTNGSVSQVNVKLLPALTQDPEFGGGYLTSLAQRASAAPPQGYAPPQGVRPQGPPPGATGPPPGAYHQPPPGGHPIPYGHGPPPAQPQPYPYPQGPGGGVMIPPPGAKRESDFHHVPPPKRSNMKHMEYERFNPEAVAIAHQRPGQAAPGAPAQHQPQQQPHQPPVYAPAPVSQAPAPQASRFVKGGSLHTIEKVQGVAPLPAGEERVTAAGPPSAEVRVGPQTRAGIGLPADQAVPVPSGKPEAPVQVSMPPPSQPSMAQVLSYAGYQPPPQQQHVYHPQPQHAPAPQQQPAPTYAPAPAQYSQPNQGGPPSNGYQAPAPQPQPQYAPQQPEPQNPTYPVYQNPYAPPQEQQQQPFSSPQQGSGPPQQQTQYAPPPQQQQQYAPPPQQQQQYAPPPQQYAPPPQQYAPPQQAPPDVYGYGSAPGQQPAPAQPQGYYAPPPF
eukprot:gene14805-20860_t